MVDYGMSFVKFTNERNQNNCVVTSTVSYNQPTNILNRHPVCIYKEMFVVFYTGQCQLLMVCTVWNCDGK